MSKARPLMIQGTMSGVGKSLVTAGLCRVLAQDGLKTAPFKGQNMALNSFITSEGAEMGRAQVVQAQAAGIEPDVRMNPVLLKPTTNTGSQVIVNGQARGTMPARDYYAYKHELVGDVEKAYESLAEEFDVIVIEGAGSPAEINLKDEDGFVNMGMARIASSPVLLVGDIDRGGVFAQLAGTMMLLDDEERAFVKGTVVNKFRGDRSILEPGLEMLRELTGVPVAGVLPYGDIDIEDEDSLSSRFTDLDAAAVVDIAVVRLPKISNFTDFISLAAMPGVGVRYVGRPSELGSPDLVVIPGTKATIADLKWLRQSGLEAAILKLASNGTPVFGICGGYQMMGRDISDPTGAEGGGTIAGMGLLPTRTLFEPEKCQTRMRGRVAEMSGLLGGMSGAAVEGYEIHMGRTIVEGGEPVVLLEDDAGLRDADAAFREASPAAPRPDGCHDGIAYGTYLHGLFDTAECAGALVSALLAAKGLSEDAAGAIDMAAYREEQFDLLADLVRNNMDMDLVYRILEEGI